MGVLVADSIETITRPCFICGGTTPDEHWIGCPFAPDDPNEVECGKCESWHLPELPCIALSAEAEDRLALRL